MAADERAYLLPLLMKEGAKYVPGWYEVGDIICADGMQGKYRVLSVGTWHDREWAEVEEID